jgi:type I restriction enzyme S subunit
VDQLGDVSGGLTQNVKREVLPLQLPFLRVANVYSNELRLDDVKSIGVSEAEVGRVQLAPRDLLIVEGNGSIEQIGRVALWDGTIDPCLHQNHLIKVRFTPVALATWSLCWLLAPAGRVAIERAASSTSGLHTLSISKVQRLPLPLAPLAEQARITSEVDRLITVALAAERDVATNTQRCMRLRQSILRRAFEGRLVDQDPTDEPASVLLERIRAERASATYTPPRRATEGVPK